MRQEITNWWKQALEDLDTARVNLKANKFYACAFFCQQAIEKSLKALVMKKEKNPNISSHSLIYLGKKVRIPSSFHSFLRELTPQYVLTRYPDASQELPYELYDENRAEFFLKKSQEVIEWIKKQLK